MASLSLQISWCLSMCSYMSSISSLCTFKHTFALSAGMPAVPWAVASVHLDSFDEAKKYPCFATEHFAPVMVVAHLSVGTDLSSTERKALRAMPSNAATASEPQVELMRKLGASFLRQAPDFLNQHVWGTLVACLYVTPQMQAALLPEVQAAVDALEYGSVVVNHSSYHGYGACVRGIWGGFQGADTSMANVSSGYGYINNALLFDHPQKHALWYEFDAPSERDAEQAVPLYIAKPVAGLVAGGARGPADCAVAVLRL